MTGRVTGAVTAATVPATWDRYRYEVVSAEMVSPVVRQLWLSPADGVLSYRPGQYVLLGDTDYRVPQRSYSAANAPRPDGRIAILVTLLPQGVTSVWAHQLQPGDAVSLEGPFGTFVTDPEQAAPVLLLGAGSGLAPIRALAEALLEVQHPRPVTLFFSGRTEADAIDRELFEGWQQHRPGFRYLLTLTRDPRAPRHERIPALLPRLFDDLTGWEVFAAGPSGFVTECASAACALGAAAADVHTEEFFPDPQPWTGTAPGAPPPDSTTRAIR